VAEPATAEGRSIRQKGWAVTAEAEANGLTLITFAGKGETGTSGSCWITNGNLAIFAAGQIMGLVYAAPDAKRTIGEIGQAGSSLRLWDGDWLQRPIADLRLQGADLVIVSPVALRDEVCKGAVSVPNLYGLPIHLARRFLLEEGWVPQPAAPDAGMWPWMLEMQAKLPEVQGCGGTGFGVCDYAYGKAGATLSVTTAGDVHLPDTPPVVGYDVTCP
jgi:hypothetical protein